MQKQFKSREKIYLLKSKEFKVNILRNATLYGFSNSMRFDLVINLFTYLLLKNKNIFIDGDGKQSRPFYQFKIFQGCICI
ncbi:MAG: hypothetical protein CM15mP14_1890 [Rhodospirillaceae bacterium]|nr:MAG: hypothetical protein CM15mP14_1890 [Rhodospirillaceae bacterium]